MAFGISADIGNRKAVPGMSEFWESKLIKAAKKEHKCLYCSKYIQIGESYWQEVGVYQGDFQHYCLCERCSFFIQNTEVADDGYLSPSSLYEAIHDRITCPTCGSRRISDMSTSEDEQYAECECENCDHKWTEDISLEAIKKFCELIKGGAANE